MKWRPATDQRRLSYPLFAPAKLHTMPSFNRLLDLRRDVRWLVVVPLQVDGVLSSPRDQWFQIRLHILKHVHQRCLEEIKCWTQASIKLCQRPSRSKASSFHQSLHSLIPLTPQDSIVYWETPAQPEYGSRCKWGCQWSSSPCEANPQEGAHSYPTSC